jgi:integrase
VFRLGLTNHSYTNEYSGTMATIRRRNDRWQVQVRRVGHPALSRSFLQRTDALAWARQTEAQLDKTGLPVDTRELQKLKVSDLVGRYLAEIVPKKRGAEIETAILKAFLRSRVASLSLSNLSPKHFATYRDQRLTKGHKGKPLQPVTVRRELGILSHCFDVAMRDWSIPISANPLKMVTMPEPSKPRTRRLEAGEGDKLLTLPSPSYLKPLILLAIETGMRRGELLSLTWKNVDLEARTAHLPMTKNGDPRTVPLSPGAVQVLQELHSAKVMPLVFPVSPNAVRLAWGRLKARAELPDLHLHDLRHEAVSRFFELGLTTPEVALISGHKDLRMLHRYTHLRPRDIAHKLASLTRETPSADAGKERS